MLSNLLVKSFVKDNENIQDEDVRNKYGYLAGIVGIFMNFLLFAFKLAIGLFTSSIAVMADAFNNLSDMASSVITIVGFKLSCAPPDEEHPFGHGRLEYLSALIVAFMVMLVGVQFIKSSVERILNPLPIKFEMIPFIILFMSILIKIWLSRFNKFIGKKIDSSALKAASLDAMGDVVTSSCVVLSFLAAKYTTIPVDGYVGIVVSLLILYAGFTLVKDTINPLLGEAPDEELVNSIVDGLMSYDMVIGVHDLIIHNYGVGKSIASVHAEIPSDKDILDIHEVIDTAERELSEKLKIYLVIHMDPVNVQDEEIYETRQELEDMLKQNTYILSMHDFRIVGKGKRKNLIFDVVVDPNELDRNITKEEIKANITNLVKSVHPEYGCIIGVDRKFY
ncbi:cation diffusion facilitator family transporter [Clostridioides mangenotii]|uniref:Cation diffusion facilitator family transporter n=1 Tax=Metaclostridioides mangenotii TaxID=1540 RepID=A0ABS4EBE2_9FIRM|nr:cation diffusion facilitator family transporter [Clostridioides mangenotii]MBP1855248.1 cation diffusion facilitator family transporter [Clostridioides mangenotii]